MLVLLPCDWPQQGAAVTAEEAAHPLVQLNCAACGEFAGDAFSARRSLTVLESSTSCCRSGCCCTHAWLKAVVDCKPGCLHAAWGDSAGKGTAFGAVLLLSCIVCC